MWYSGLNTKGPRIYPWHGANGWNLVDTMTGVFFFQYGGYFLPKVTPVTNNGYFQSNNDSFYDVLPQNRTSEILGKMSFNLISL